MSIKHEYLLRNYFDFTKTTSTETLLIRVRKNIFLIFLINLHYFMTEYNFSTPISVILSNFAFFSWFLFHHLWGLWGNSVTYKEFSLETHG